MGSVIVEQVVKKLIENHGMRDASVVILAGSSAGGTGVFMNIDRVQNYLKAARSSALVRGIVDSAWYLKRPEMDQNVRFYLKDTNYHDLFLRGVGLKWRK